MSEARVSIGQVKRDISDLVNRVAYGGERIVLTSRGKPKAALVSMDEYQRIIEAETGKALNRLEAWLEESDRLLARILDKRQLVPYDADTILERARVDLEERHDYLRGD